MAVRPETYSTFFHKIIDVHFLLPLLGLSFEHRRMNGYTLYVAVRINCLCLGADNSSGHVKAHSREIRTAHSWDKWSPNIAMPRLL